MGWSCQLVLEWYHTRQSLFLSEFTLQQEQDNAWIAHRSPPAPVANKDQDNSTAVHNVAMHEIEQQQLYTASAALKEEQSDAMPASS